MLLVLFLDDVLLALLLRSPLDELDRALLLSRPLLERDRVLLLSRPLDLDRALLLDRARLVGDLLLVLFSSGSEDPFFFLPSSFFSDFAFFLGGDLQLEGDSVSDPSSTTSVPNASRNFSASPPPYGSSVASAGLVSDGGGVFSASLYHTLSFSFFSSSLELILLGFGFARSTTRSRATAAALLVVPETGLWRHGAGITPTG